MKNDQKFVKKLSMAESGEKIQKRLDGQGTTLRWKS